jgi:hypothetical protein
MDEMGKQKIDCVNGLTRNAVATSAFEEQQTTIALFEYFRF